MLKRVALSLILLSGIVYADPTKGVGVPLFTRRHASNDTYVIESIKQGVNHCYIDGLDVRVYGRLSPTAFLNIATAVAEMPKHLRIYADDICVNQDLGKATLNGKIVAIIVGLGGEGRIILEKRVLRTLNSTKDVLYHEAGHNYDRANGNPGAEAPWGIGDSVSEYGSSSNRDDFAETFTNVLLNLKEYSSRSEEDWKKDPLSPKKRIIMKIMETK